ncbi:ATP-binding cassette domain-containing protein, partial [Oceanobacillus massiliensis]|uniref:ATP-binding cassette domain-containing protein n=1 Tax=Oceanobacillus massiliensis TaxID=1465765 RepID=UPI0030187422
MFLKMDNVGKYFHNEEKQSTFEVFSGIDISVEENQFVSILGPTGCGKSTLLSMVAGLEPASEGEMILEGKEIKQPGPD